MSFPTLLISGIAGALAGSVVQDYIGEHGDLDAAQNGLNYLSRNVEILCYTTALALFSTKYLGHKGYKASITAMKIAAPLIVTKIFIRARLDPHTDITKSLTDIVFDTVTILNSAALARESTNVAATAKTSSAFISAGILANLSNNFVSLKAKGSLIACAAYVHHYFYKGN